MNFYLCIDNKYLHCLCQNMSKILFKPGMKEQVGQKNYILQDDEITTMSWYVYMQYHTFLKKSTKDNKMKKVTLKIDNMHFFGQLPKCMNISPLIDKFMLISHPTDKIYFYFLLPP